MKKAICLLLAAVFASSVLTARGTAGISKKPFANNTLTSSDDSSRYDVSYYDVNACVSPMFWEGNVVVNECVYPIKASNGTLQPFKLLYPATRILFVKDYSLQRKYAEGVDWALNANGDLVVLEGGSIPVVEYTAIHYPDNSGTYQHLDEPEIEPGSEYAWGLTEFICVTYVHAADDYYDDARPEAMGDRFPRTVSKLENGEAVKIVNVGDSFTCGAGPTFVPAFPQMTVDALGAKFDNYNIYHANCGVSGAVSDPNDNGGHPNYSLASVFNAFPDPDLIVICFGANDSNYNGYGMSDEDFRRNMSAHIEYYRSQAPDVEILLVSTTHSNYLLWHKERYLAHEAILHELADTYEHVGVCDILALTQPMYDRGKIYEDFRADIVHPNDFTTRIITQAIVDCLRVPTVGEAAASALKKIRSAVSPARGKEAQYEAALAGYYEQFVSLGDTTAIRASTAAKREELSEAMRYCAEGSHVFEHNVEPATCGAAGESADVCAECGLRRNETVLPAIAGDHVLGEPEITLTATAHITGVSTRFCTKCPYKEETEIPKASGVVNRALHIPYDCNYYDIPNVYAYRGDAMIEFDIAPICVDTMASPGGPCYFGVWLGSDYHTFVGYDFRVRKFVVTGDNGSWFYHTFAFTTPLVSAGYEWEKNADGNRPVRHVAIRVNGSTAAVYLDGTQILTYTGAQITSTDQLVIFYAKGEYFIDSFRISRNGAVLVDRDFEDGAMPAWSYDTANGARSDVRAFDMREYFPDEHVHTSELVASHPANAFHGAYDEYECSVCFRRTLVAVAAPAARPNGDADGDGSLNAADVRLIMRYLAGYADGGFDALYADFNGDGRINARDVLLLMLFLVGGEPPENSFA